MRMHADCKASALAPNPCCRSGFARFQRIQLSFVGSDTESKWHSRRQRRRRASPAQAFLLEQASGLASGCLDGLQHIIAAGTQLDSAFVGGPGSVSGGTPAATALLALANLTTALQPACFDAECERQKDMLLVARYAT